MDNEEVLEELGEEVESLEKELVSTESEEEPATVREKRQQAQDLAEEIEEQLEFLSKVAENNHNG